MSTLGRVRSMHDNGKPAIYLECRLCQSKQFFWGKKNIILHSFFTQNYIQNNLDI